jgi:DNA-binding transcriptional regulator LsrR (DeoR family)
LVRKKRNSKPPRNPHVVGSAHPGSKLNEKQVIEIRALYGQGKTQQELANEYGVARQSISKIINRVRFKHV